MAKGMRFVKRAGQWIVYSTKNNGQTDDAFWFIKEEDAKQKLQELIQS